MSLLWLQPFCSRVPTTWDEVRFVDGYPGKYVVLARRHGDTWYVAGINAEKEPLKIKVSLPMFEAGEELSFYTDDKELKGSVENKKLNKKQQTDLFIPCNGGVLICNE